MPSYCPGPGERSQPRAKPWHARQRREGLEWSLGYFSTLEEARAAEKAFERDMPKKHGSTGKHQKETDVAA